MQSPFEEQLNITYLHKQSEILINRFLFLPVSYSFMMDCWKENPDERPSFQELVLRLEELMLEEVEYFDFNKVDESKDCYQVKESRTAEITGQEKAEQ